MAKLLFCEDSESIRKLISNAMSQTPHEVLIAEDGRTGLAVVRSERPDMLITDLLMPGLNGVELHDAIRSDPEVRDLPIVFLTASTHGDLMKVARDRPVPILMKPFSPADLRRQINELLERSAIPTTPVTSS